MKKKKMGRGMDILFDYNGFDSPDSPEAKEQTAPLKERSDKGGDKSESQQKGGISTLRTALIEPDRNQPRTVFDDEAISELAQSVEEHGILQPILVRPTEQGYKIVAGERRWRAAMRAGLREVPVIIREMTDLEAAQLALIENLQRESLNPVEEARGYKRLIDEFSMTQEQIAKKVSKSRSVVANSLRLLNLPDKSLELLSEGKISAGHAKVLAGIEDKAFCDTIAQRIVDESLSVRETERLVSKGEEPDGSKLQKQLSKIAERDSYCDEVELSLSEYLAKKVKVVSRKNGSGQLRIDYKNLDELKELVKELAEKADKA